MASAAAPAAEGAGLPADKRMVSHAEAVGGDGNPVGDDEFESGFDMEEAKKDLGSLEVRAASWLSPPLGSRRRRRRRRRARSACRAAQAAEDIPPKS